MTELIDLLVKIGYWWLFLSAIVSVYIVLTGLLIWRMDAESADQAPSAECRGAREGLDE